MRNIVDGFYLILSFSITIAVIILLVWCAIKGIIFLYPIVKEYPYIIGALTFILFCWTIGDALNGEIE
jgi:hypothetical protein